MTTGSRFDCVLGKVVDHDVLQANVNRAPVRVRSEQRFDLVAGDSGGHLERDDGSKNKNHKHRSQGFPTRSQMAAARPGRTANCHVANP
jgi:hypothetical protein